MRKLLYPLAAFLLTGSLFAADPFLGTWKLNIAKSKYTGANPAPKDITIVVETHGDQVMVSGKGTAADGSPISIKYMVPETGGTVQYSEGGPPAGVSVVAAKKKADSPVFDATNTKDGKVIEKGHAVVSADGKILRNTVKGTDPQGKPFESMEVWDKQ
jgi:hypothetical protein